MAATLTEVTEQTEQTELFVANINTQESKTTAVFSNGSIAIINEAHITIAQPLLHTAPPTDRIMHTDERGLHIIDRPAGETLSDISWDNVALCNDISLLRQAMRYIQGIRATFTNSDRLGPRSRKTLNSQFDEHLETLDLHEQSLMETQRAQAVSKIEAHALWMNQLGIPTVVSPEGDFDISLMPYDTSPHSPQQIDLHTLTTHGNEIRYTLSPYDPYRPCQVYVLRDHDWAEVNPDELYLYGVQLITFQGILPDIYQLLQQPMRTTQQYNLKDVQHLFQAAATIDVSASLHGHRRPV